MGVRCRYPETIIIRKLGLRQEWGDRVLQESCTVRVSKEAGPLTR